MKVERIRLLEEYIRSKGMASIPEITKEFNISINTARRDITALLSNKQFKKVHGGVSVVDLDAPPYAQRRDLDLSQKQAIGLLAAQLVSDNMVIFLDSGSTTPHILAGLKHKSNITVITYSLSVLIEACKYPHLSIIGLGGIFNHKTASFSGHTILEEITQLNIQLAFMSATAVSLQYGLSNYSYQEAEIKMVVAKNSSRIILVADHSKFGHAAVRSFLPFSQLQGIVTDMLPPKEFISAIEDNHIQLIYPGQKREDENG